MGMTAIPAILIRGFIGKKINTMALKIDIAKKIPPACIGRPNKVGVFEIFL